MNMWRQIGSFLGDAHTIAQEIDTAKQDIVSTTMRHIEQATSEVSDVGQELRETADSTLQPIRDEMKGTPQHEQGSSNKNN